MCHTHSARCCVWALDGVLLLCSGSLSGLEQAVLEGQDACKGLATSATIFRHTLSELDAALDSLDLRDAWAGNRPSNGVSSRYSTQYIMCLRM